MKQARVEFLRKLKIESEADDVPNVTKNNAEFLHFLTRLKKAKSILEIGTANGYSTIWFADAVEEFDGHVTTIDHSTPSRAWALENFKNILLIRILNSKLPKKRNDIFKIKYSPPILLKLRL